MAYVVYHYKTTRVLHLNRSTPDSFKSKGAARAALTRAARSGNMTEEMGNEHDYRIAELQEFRERIELKEIRHGVVGSEGKEFTVPVNTPWTSGPWSETYWSS